jgi:Cu-processing system permease protein
VNLTLLLVPLVAVTLGALAIAAERERGTLVCLLAQPVLPGEILIGKFVGLSAALLATLAFGFGASGLVIAWNAGGEHAAAYVGVIGLAWMLGLANISLGLLISSLARSAAAAVGAAVFVWLALVFLGDLGLMATSLVLRLSARSLLALSLLNPLQVFKLAAVVTIRGNAEALGPAGAFAVARSGGILLPVLAAILAAWVVIPLAIAGLILQRRSAV